VRRLSAASFIEQVLGDARIQELPAELQQRLLQVALMSPSARARELRIAFEEAARG
jgi:hypothetical protein